MPYHRRCLTGVTLAALVSAGCAVPERVASGGTSSAEPVNGISYELTAAGTAPLLGGLFESAPGPVVLPAGDDGEAAPPAPDGPKSGAGETTEVVRGPRVCRLEIQRFGTIARGRLTLYAESGGAGGNRPPVEAYQLDLAAAEFPLILDDLNGAGFFGGQQRPGGGASIALQRGEEVVTKEWTPEPRLDDLAERVYREGRRLPERQAARPGRAEVKARG